jgi:hypothetical protein
VLLTIAKIVGLVLLWLAGLALLGWLRSARGGRR